LAGSATYRSSADRVGSAGRYSTFGSSRLIALPE
jgi:hypothetical protein